MGSTNIAGLESISEETIKALIDAGYKTVEAIAIALSTDLVDDVGISKTLADEIIAKSALEVGSPPLTAADLLKMAMVF